MLIHVDSEYGELHYWDTGHEHQLRAALKGILGNEKYDLLLRYGEHRHISDSDGHLDPLVFGVLLRGGRCQILRFAWFELPSYPCTSFLMSKASSF